MDPEKRILYTSFAIFIVLVFGALFIPLEIIFKTNMVVLGIIILIIPYSLYRFLEFRKFKIYEREFPAFLRDIAEAHRAGLTTIQAINTVSRSDYGQLSKEIRKMNNQLSWNVPLEKVLGDFKKRARTSKNIVRSMMVIGQANKTGGNIESTLESLASNIELIKEVQEEKATLLNQQVLMMYAIFFIFLGLTIALLRFLVPLLETETLQPSSSFGTFQSFGGNPCNACLGTSDARCIGCQTFSYVSQSFGFGEHDDPRSYYRSIFFVMILIQGFFSGLLSGQITSDSIIAGMKHSMIMVLSGFFIFILVVHTGIV